MRGLSTLIVLQALLSTISSILMSQMSWIGKVSISVLYTEYGIFKVWWKTAVLLFALQLILILLLWIFKRLLPSILSIIPIILLLLCGLAGAYLTYLDFTQTNHQMMKANFHYGTYLIWGAWVVSCLYFLLVRRKSEPKEVRVQPETKSVGEDPTI